MVCLSLSLVLFLCAAMMHMMHVMIMMISFVFPCFRLASSRVKEHLWEATEPVQGRACWPDKTAGLQTLCDVIVHFYRGTRA